MTRVWMARGRLLERQDCVEGALFTGKNLRIWDTSVSDWVPGIIISADSKTLTLELSEHETAQETAAAAKRQRIIPFEQIAKAKLLHS